MLTLADVEATLKHLAEGRPIFHSEADFQHALRAGDPRETSLACARNWSIRCHCGIGAATWTCGCERPVGLSCWS